MVSQHHTPTISVSHKYKRTGMFFDVFAAKHDAQVQRVVQVRIV